MPGQSTHFPRKSHTMPPICWGAADTEGGGSEGALPPGRGVGRWIVEGGLGFIFCLFVCVFFIYIYFGRMRVNRFVKGETEQIDKSG